MIDGQIQRGFRLMDSQRLVELDDDVRKCENSEKENLNEKNVAQVAIDLLSSSLPSPVG